jgi:anti-sigma factor RsiW
MKLPCRTIRNCPDCLSRELPAATSAAIRKHLAECRDCAAFAETQRRIRESLSRAVRNESVPLTLAARIHNRLSQFAG